MRIFANKDENKSELECVVCNRCGKKLKVENGYLHEGCFAGNQMFGYFSSRDRMRYRFDLCEACFDELLACFSIPAEISEESELM